MSSFSGVSDRFDVCGVGGVLSPVLQEPPLKSETPSPPPLEDPPSISNPSYHPDIILVGITISSSIIPSFSLFLFFFLDMTTKENKMAATIVNTNAIPQASSTICPPSLLLSVKPLLLLFLLFEYELVSSPLLRAEVEVVVVL